METLKRLGGTAGLLVVVVGASITYFAPQYRLWGWILMGAGFLLVYLGGEWVGICSALLIGFFHERAAPVRAGARAFITNRFGDFG